MTRRHTLCRRPFIVVIVIRIFLNFFLLTDITHLPNFLTTPTFVILLILDLILLARPVAILHKYCTLLLSGR